VLVLPRASSGSVRDAVAPAPAAFCVQVRELISRGPDPGRGGGRRRALVFALDPSLLNGSARGRRRTSSRVWSLL